MAKTLNDLPLTHRVWTWLAVGSILLVAGIRVVTAVDISESRTSDATADAILIRAAANGLDLNTDIELLGSKLGIAYRNVPLIGTPNSATVHPRTPGSLILLSPLLLIKPELAHLVALALNATATLALILFVVPRLLGTDLRQVWPIAVLTVGGLSFAHCLQFGAWSGLIALVAVAGFARSDVFGGAFVGAMTAFKLYPGVLVLGGNRGWRWITAALTSATAVTALGLIAFRLNPLEAVHSLSAGAHSWLAQPGNASLASWVARVGIEPGLAVVIGISPVSGLLLFRRSWSLWRLGAFSLVVAVVSSPLAWSHYDLLLMPVAVTFWLMGGTPRIWGLAWGACQVAFVVVDLHPVLMVASVIGLGRLALLVGVLSTPNGWDRFAGGPGLKP